MAVSVRTGHTNMASWLHHCLSSAYARTMAAHFRNFTTCSAGGTNT